MESFPNLKQTLTHEFLYLNMNQDNTIVIAKLVTLVCLVVLLIVYPVNVRAAVYLGMHLSYCIWFLFDQYIIKKAVRYNSGQNSRPQPVNYSPLKAIVIVAIVGVFYALPGWNALNNPQPAGSLTLGMSVGMFFLGSMTASRFHIPRDSTSLPGFTAVSESYRKLAGNLRYSGEIIRYSSFALLSGSPWSWLVVLCVIALEHPYGILRFLREIVNRK